MSDEIEVRRIICHNGTGGCYLCCGFLAYVDKKENRIIRIEPNSDHPVNRGWMCPDRAKIGSGFFLNYLYHKAQLLHPLKRVGERGENRWKQIGYDEALDEIAEKLKEIIDKYGPESIGIVEGTFRSDSYWARARLMNLLGNPNNVADPGTVCGKPMAAQWQLTLGVACSCGGMFQWGIPGISCYVIIGHNPAESFPLEYQTILSNKKRGMKLIVFDPRLTETARHADYWFQIRPGTDTAALLAWINVIIKEKLYDANFLLQWTNAPFLVGTDQKRLLREKDVKEDGSENKFVVWNESLNEMAVWDPETQEYLPSNTTPALLGTFKVKLADGKETTCKTVFQMLAERAAEYTPEKVAEITWLDPEKLREAAIIWATSPKPKPILAFVSSHQIGRNSSRVHQCVMILHLLAGMVPMPVSFPGPRGPGGIYVRESELELAEALPVNQRKKMIGADKFKVMAWPQYEITTPLFKRIWGVSNNMSGHGHLVPAPLLWRAILTGKPYPIKALITWTANPMVWAANTKIVYKALKSPNLELHVVVDHVMTPTAALADYVIPAACKSLETPFITNWQDAMGDIIVGQAAIRPLSERRSDYEFWRGLAIRLGFGEYFPWKDPEDVCNYRLKPLGLTLDEAAQLGLIPSNPCTNEAFKEINPETSKPYGFATITRKAEIWPVSFEIFGYDPLPFYEEPPESPISTPEVAKEYPLILTTGGRFRPMFHSEYRHWGMGFREQHPYPIVEIHYQTAREYGISDGDWVWIETRRGRILQKARLSATIHPKVVNAQSHWWYPEMPAEEPYLYGVWISNANVLTLDEPEALDEMVGGWCNRALLCKVYKAEHLPPILHQLGSP
ncbi:MAG: molybdopterin-dependent oxidoreductase [Candidatus Bathyarchaeia archaeon]